MRFTVVPLMRATEFVFGLASHVSRHFGALIVGAATSDALYEDLSHIAWEGHIGPHVTIAGVLLRRYK